MNSILRLSVLIAVALFSVSCSRNKAASPPSVNYPRQIDLGHHELGDLAIASFSVSNSGGADLVIDGIRTNCSCSGIERRQESGEYAQIDSLLLRPGEEIELRVRVSVRGVPVGAKASNAIYFNTNDPVNPEGKIAAVIPWVTGGVRPFPEHVVFGELQTGTEAVKIVDVRDDAQVMRVIESATSSHPNKVTARLLDTSSEKEEISSLPGKRVALIEIRIDTITPGDINATVSINVPGRSPEVVKVSARVVKPIEISPPSVVFPRNSPDGPIYDATILVRSTTGHPIEVLVKTHPDSLRITKESSSPEPGGIILKISASGMKSAREERIVLLCRSNGKEYVEELRVLYTKP